MNWRIGDKARIISAKHDKSFIGKIVTIVGLRPNIKTGELSCEVDLPPSAFIKSAYPKNQYALFTPDALVPLDDGNELGSWDDCCFKPKELVT